MKIAPICLILISCFAFISKLQAQDFITLEGKILAADSKEPIPFASIGIPEKGIGNICNETGNFELKIPAGNKNAQICITALGYKERCLLASTFLAKNPTVLLEPANLQLATVEIKAISAEGLVKEAIKRIPANYAQNPTRFTLYQRQLESINNQPAYILESVNEGYRDNQKTDFQFAIRKARGLSASAKGKELMNDRWIQVWAVAGFDNLFAFQKPYLNLAKYKSYDYQFEKQELIGQDTAYVISYSPKRGKDGSEKEGMTGRIFIHKQTFGIMRVEETKNAAFLHNFNNNLEAKLINKACKCEIKYSEFSWEGNYKRVGNSWYLNSASSNVITYTAKATAAVPEKSQMSSQVVVTNLQPHNANPISGAERVKPFRNAYSTSPKDMNEAYWQQYNVLPLPAAFQKISRAQ